MNRIKWYGPSLLLIATALAVMLLGPGVVRQIAWAQSDAKIRLIKEDLAKNATLAELSSAYRDVAKAVEPSVVHITVSARAKHAAHNHLDEDLRKFFGPRLGPMVPPNDDEQQQPDEGGQRDSDMDKYDVPHPYGNGSGWVYDDKGHIITNNHVIEGADEIEVRFHDGSKRMAKLVGTDPKTDVAVLLVTADNLHPATRATEPVEQGDIVCAFGSPLRFDFSMSQGIVSAKGRQLHILSDNGYEDFIQTDAAINPGNSGGPLCNIQGQVVGMNSAIASNSGFFSGLGFAIPIDLANDVIEQLIKSGKVVRGYLGIQIKDLSPEMADNMGYKGKGVLVINPMDGGPADKAGIKADDIIVKVNGKAVETADTLRFAVADIAAGAKVPVELFRDGKTLTVTVTVEAQPASMADAGNPGRPEMAPAPENPGAQILRHLGLDLANLTPEMANQLKIPKIQAGVVIRAVRSDSVAASVGLAPREVILAVAGAPVKTVDDFVAALNKGDLTKGVRLRVMYNGMYDTVLLRLPPGYDHP